MITVFGATGYTGQMVIRSLALAQLPFRIAGRSAQKLEELSSRLSGHPDWLVADASQPATLPALFQGTQVFINLAGPFTDLGEKVISQAAMSGVHYIDTTNELGYVFRARSYHEMARRTGAALVPACGFEVALADCAAHLAGSRFMEKRSGAFLDAVHIIYDLKGNQSSRGTRLSAVRSLATSWIAFRDGEWVGQIPGGKVRKFACHDRQLEAFSIPSSESVTIPAHLQTRRVDTWMANIRGARFWAPIAIPLLARLSRSVLRGMILSMAARSGKTPMNPGDFDSPVHSSFNICVRVEQDGRQAGMILSGQDPYQITGEIVTYAARRMSEPGFKSSGFLSPAKIFDPRAFLGYAEQHWGIKIQAI